MIHPSQYHFVFSPYLLYLGSNLVLPVGESLMPTGLEEGALESRQDHLGHSLTHQSSAFIGPLGQSVGWSTISPKRLPSILIIKGTRWYIWSIYDDDREGWDRLGTFWWDGDVGRNIRVTARLQIGGLF